MLKQRVVAFLPVKAGIVVQSIGFAKYLPVGRPRIAVEFLSAWGIDEIVLVDIDATREGRCIDADLVKDAARAGFVPLTVGGGVRSVEDMRRLIQSGADKVSINAAAQERPELIGEGAAMFGAQCVVVSLDFRRVGPAAMVFTRGGTVATGADIVTAARAAELRGAGEILLNSIDRDGARAGYDIETATQIAQAVGIPLVLLGGVGRPEHLVEGLSVPNVSGVAAGNFLHYSEHAATTAKGFVRSRGKRAVRVDTHADYSGAAFDDTGRLARASDERLEEMLFEFHPKETI